MCDLNPCNGARESPSFNPTAAVRAREWAGVLPQKEVNGGSDAKRRAGLTAESGEMAEESSQ
jgi:hypothetical protein